MTVQLQFGSIRVTESTEHSMILEPPFFTRDVQIVAKELLGKSLCVAQGDGGVVRSVITETEAYDGEQDLACHARNGKTERNSVMYMQGGVWYVYLCYGMHWMVNVVTGENGYPAAVLIRGTLTFQGPGRLSNGLQIDGSLNGRKIARSSLLWIEERGEKVERIFSGPRIGVDFAGPKWRNIPYRFWFSK
jgi:DNA-3-methyladenine glycosylase